MFVRLLVAMLCGLLVGTERILASKTAGMRTYALVSLGSALFVVISETIISIHGLGANVDPLHMAGQIVTGIGFLGAGLIIVRKEHLVGATTASGIWVAAGIGIAAGFGLFWLSIIATILMLCIFLVGFLERKLVKELPHYPGMRLDEGDNADPKE